VLVKDCLIHSAPASTGVPFLVLHRGAWHPCSSTQVLAEFAFSLTISSLDSQPLPRAIISDIIGAVSCVRSCIWNGD
jgi:hypothetical protein